MLKGLSDEILVPPVAVLYQLNDTLVPDELDAVISTLSPGQIKLATAAAVTTSRFGTIKIVTEVRVAVTQPSAEIPSTKYVVFVFRGPVTNGFEVETGVPPVGAVYHLKEVLVPEVLAAVNVTLSPGQIDGAVGVMVGASKFGVTVTGTNVRVAVIQPSAFSPST